MKKIKIATVIGVPALALVLASNAQAQVNMALDQGLTYTYSEAGFGATLAGNPSPMIINNDLIGIYAFDVRPGGTPNLASPLYATCVSPQGDLDWGGPYTYTSETLAAAGSGQYPSSWVPGGIQNANYLFTLLSGQITGGGISGQEGSLADQGAGLALAMYTALYNSTALGQANPAGNFQITSFADAYAQADYNTDLTDLNGAKVNQVVGSLLVGVYPDSQYGPNGQEQLYVSGASSQALSAVPEPSTILAGALMLVPLGASTLRILRKNRTA